MTPESRAVRNANFLSISQRVKLLIYQATYVPTLTYDHVFLIVTDRTEQVLCVVPFLWLLPGEEPQRGQNRTTAASR